MARTIFLFTLMIATINSANAQELRFMDHKVSGHEKIWSYALKCRDSESSCAILLDIPKSTYVRLATREEKVPPNPGQLLKQERTGQASLRVQFENGEIKNQWIYFEVKAPKSETKNGKIAWAIEPNCFEKNVRLPGPVPDDTTVQPFFTVGGSWSRRGNDFNVVNNAVSIEYDGNFRPSLTAGLLVDLKYKCFESMKMDLLLSLEFGVDSSRLIDGIVVGLALPGPRFGNLFLGVSMRTQRKLRTEFETVAKIIAEEINSTSIGSLSVLSTKDNKINAKAIKCNFERFNSLNNPTDYDGFPTVDPRDGTTIFYGSPLIDYTNWVFVCGIAMQIDVGKLMDVIRKIPV